MKTLLLAGLLTFTSFGSAEIVDCPGGRQISRTPFHRNPNGTLYSDDQMCGLASRPTFVVDPLKNVPDAEVFVSLFGPDPGSTSPEARENQLRWREDVADWGGQFPAPVDTEAVRAQDLAVFFGLGEPTYWFNQRAADSRSAFRVSFVINCETFHWTSAAFHRYPNIVIAKIQIRASRKFGDTYCFPSYNGFVPPAYIPVNCGGGVVE